MFKTKSSKVEKILKEAGFTNIEINKERPRKGCFVVAVVEVDSNSNSKPPAVVIELLDMPRPFKKLRELDLDAVLQTVIAKSN